MDSTKLSNHFNLSKFLHIDKYPDNKPSQQVVANLTYGCLHISWAPFSPPRHYVRMGYYK